MTAPQHTQNGMPPIAPVPPSKSAMAIAGLVIGILALLGSWIPILNNFAFVLVILGVVFSIVGLVGISHGKKSGKGLAVAALVISIVAGVVVLGTQSLYSAAIDEATSGPTVEDATSDGDSSNASASSEASEEAEIVITDEALTTDSLGDAKVTGTLTNNSGGELDFVSVEYVFYDEDGAQIDTAFASTSNLKDGGTWKFEATSFVDADDVASYERSEVTAW